MRLRDGAQGFPREAARNPQLRLAAARLYVITPEASPDRILEVATSAQRGGADLIQLRHKTMPRGELLDLARKLRRLISDALFVVNDHVDIALLSDADGVHLGPDDLSIPAARRVTGKRLFIGASASTIEAAKQAIQEGADYLGCGPAFATPVKTEKKVIGSEGVAAINGAVGETTPMFAIGGIDESNLGELISLGVRRACVIRAVADSPDPEQATRRLRAMLTSE